MNVRLTLAAAVIASFAFVSCNKEGKEPERDRPFNYEAVRLCKSYLGMTVSEAAARIQEDWDYTTAYTSGKPDGEIMCMPNGESICAIFENYKVYRVDYSRYLPFTYDEAMNIAKRICTDVNSYYDNDNKTNYKSAEIWLNGSEYYDTYYSHSEFMSKWNSAASGSVYMLKEKWGLYSKSWQFYTDLNNGEYQIQFVIDLGND